MNAAVTYSRILRLPELKASIWDWNNAAFSWSRADAPDSALFNLEMIAEIDTVTYSDYLDIVGDGDYNSLKNLSRWTQVTNKLFDNASNNFRRFPSWDSCSTS